MMQMENLPYVPISKIPSDRSSLLVVKAKDSNKYILKTFPINFAGKLQYDSEKLVQKLSHDNIIKIKEAHNSLQTVVLEYAPFGDFCNLLMSGTKLPEIVTRTYFHQLVEGVEHLHKNGIAHLDLKLDNLLIGANKSLKIIDFDLSQRIEEEKRGYARGKGTTNYRAPEVRMRRCSNYKAADIYSMGVILFAVYTSLPPYTETDKGECDLWYQLLMTKQDEYFVKLSKYVNLSQDFKDLFCGMVCEKPEQRFDISQIKSTNWYKGPTLSAQDLEKEMQKILKLN